MRRTAMFAIVGLVLTSGGVTAGTTAASAAGGVHPKVRGALTELAGLHGCTATYPTTGCVTDNNIGTPDDVAVSPDGKQVAVVGESWDVVNIYNRNAAGKLTYARCVSRTGGTSGGTGQRSCMANSQLTGVRAAMFTHDGRSLFIVSNTGGTTGTLVNLDRNPKTGALSAPSSSPCFNVTGTNGCAEVRSLAGAGVIAEDPKDNTLLVGSDGSAGALILFTRDPSTRKVAKADCLNQGGTIGCRESAQIDGVTGVAVDRKSGIVWMASRSNDAVASYYINTSVTPFIDPLSCFWAKPTDNEWGCVKTKAVFAPDVVRVSSSGAAGGYDAFVTSFNENSLLEFSDDSAHGFGTYVGCRSESGSIAASGATCLKDTAMAYVQDVVVSPDNKNVYVASGKGNPATGAEKIASYSLANGILEPLPAPYDCVKTPLLGGDCPSAPGMVGPTRLAIAPDGSNIYVADSESPAVLTLDRALPPKCKSVKKKTKHDKPAKFSLHCKDPNGDGLGYAILKVKHGKVGKVKHGKATFTPHKHFAGTASFKVAVTDGGLASSPVTDKLHTTKSKHHH